MLLEFLTWWYSKGWLDFVKKINQWITGIWRMFSVSILLKTLFQPWKRIISPPGKSLDAIVRAMIDNLVSRVIGFTVRMLVLTAALIVTSMAAMVGGAVSLGWPLLLPATVFFALKVFIG
jgi:hypothetical protein